MTVKRAFMDLTESQAKEIETYQEHLKDLYPHQVVSKTWAVREIFASGLKTVQSRNDFITWRKTKANVESSNE